MLDRATIVDEEFIQRVQQGTFPGASSSWSTKNTTLSPSMAVDIFDSQIKSRLLDIEARRLKEKGLSFYTIGSSGHEGNAAVAAAFSPDDMAFLHYRSGGFFLQRAKQVPSEDGVRNILLSLVASADDPISGGRHKVFGSKALNIPPQTSTIASHLPKALGAALSLVRAKELAVETTLAQDSVVMVSFGDASFNHASAQTTLNACAWIHAQGYPVPMIFLCEDNGIGISVPTPESWVVEQMQDNPHIHYLQADGLNIADTYAKTQEAIAIARHKRKPVFLHMKCVRLLGHAGSDIESQYRSGIAIQSTEANDPLLHSARMLIEESILSAEKILALYEGNRSLIEAKAQQVLESPKLESAEAIMASLLPTVGKDIPPIPAQELREACFGGAYQQTSIKRNLCQNINFALTDILLQYPQTLILGEDVGKKGGVYRVTADLQKRFGQRRVFDTLLDETTILGTSIGLAHNGFLPIPEIQFLAYVHNAEDQLRGEASTLSFFSNGQYSNPMVVRIASLAYQKGFGGHFHNDNSIAALRDLPGVVIACPSNGQDAAKMLRTCVALAHGQQRVVIFLEPIALYMTKDLHETGDNAWLFPYPDPSEHIGMDELGVHGSGDTVVLSYANGYYLSRKVAHRLKKDYGYTIKVVDIRWLNPLPEKAIMKELRAAKRVLIVDEGRKTGSISEALMSMLIENGLGHLAIKRVTGEDCFIPLGHAWQHVLPSETSITNALIEMHAQTEEKKRGRFVTT